MGFLHRDDVPFEFAEKVTEELKKKHPDAKVFFVGDMAEIPEAVLVAINVQEMSMQISLLTGTCYKCKDYIPGYMKAVEDGNSEFEIPADWAMFRNGSDGNPSHYLCADCSKDVGEGMIHEVTLGKKKKNDEKDI